jgi:hypothetical protein
MKKVFVASYDLQGHGGGIPPCLHTGSRNSTLTPYIASAQTALKTPLPTVTPLLVHMLLSNISGIVVSHTATAQQWQFLWLLYSSCEALCHGTLHWEHIFPILSIHAMQDELLPYHSLAEIIYPQHVSLQIVLCFTV